LDNKHIATREYTRQLTKTGTLHEDSVISMRQAGCSDGEIPEINQVSTYSNCIVLGLGCVIESDILGLLPNNSNATQDWEIKNTCNPRILQ